MSAATITGIVKGTALLHKGNVTITLHEAAHGASITLIQRVRATTSLQVRGGERHTLLTDQLVGRAREES